MLIVTIIREMEGGRMSVAKMYQKAPNKITQMLLSLQCIFTIFALSNNIMGGINAKSMMKYFSSNMSKF